MHLIKRTKLKLNNEHYKTLANAIIEEGTTKRIHFKISRNAGLDKNYQLNDHMKLILPFDEVKKNKELALQIQKELHRIIEEEDPMETQSFSREDLLEMHELLENGNSVYVTARKIALKRKKDVYYAKNVINRYLTDNEIKKVGNLEMAISRYLKNLETRKIHKRRKNEEKKQKEESLRRKNEEKKQEEESLRRKQEEESAVRIKNKEKKPIERSFTSPKELIDFYAKELNIVSKLGLKKLISDSTILFDTLKLEMNDWQGNITKLKENRAGNIGNAYFLLYKIMETKLKKK